MHRLTRGVTRRLEALEHCLGTIPEPETSAETSRRLELVKAALNGIRPADLLEEERETYSKALLYAPVFHELITEGVLGPYLDWQDEEI